MNIIILLLLISVIIRFLTAFLFYKKYTSTNLDIAKVLIAIKRARYGDINLRLSNLKNKELENTINRLIETMYDRELMIKEYQTTLSNKNLSLEEILKKEKSVQEQRNEFTATLTHDMKVPVIAELNSINFLLDGRFGSLNEKQKEALTLMKASNQELKELIENILEIYKAEESSIILDKTNVIINDFISTIIEEMQPIAQKNGHKIIFSVSNSNNLSIIIDKFQIKRVLKNLIQNAISYSKPKTNIFINTKCENNFLIIEILNEGNAITTEELNMIFNKYYSANSKYRKTGTGLGLYLSKQIIDLHNGYIEADNSKNGFTTFLVKIPL